MRLEIITGAVSQDAHAFVETNWLPPASDETIVNLVQVWQERLESLPENLRKA